MLHKNGFTLIVFSHGNTLNLAFKFYSEIRELNLLILNFPGTRVSNCPSSLACTAWHFLTLCHWTTETMDYPVKIRYSLMKKNVLLILAACLQSTQVFAQDIHFSEQIAEGGIAIIVIIGLSILALAVAIERSVNFRKKYIVPNDLSDQARSLWQAGEFGQLQHLLSQENNTLARIIQFMVIHRLQSFPMISAGVADIASLELRQHQQKAYALAIVATVAPIVGLLGTVIGMIEAFHVIAFSEGMGNPALLAGGISKALINTAAGLSIALPALGLHHFFKHRSALLGLTLEKQINQLLNEWFMPAVTTVPNLQVVSHAH